MEGLFERKQGVRSWVLQQLVYMWETAGVVEDGKRLWKQSKGDVWPTLPCARSAACVQRF
jgi:hypothetical protein